MPGSRSMKGIVTRLLIVLTLCWIGGWLYGVFVAFQEQDGELLWLSIAMATLPPAAIWWILFGKTGELTQSSRPDRVRSDRRR